MDTQIDQELIIYLKVEINGQTYRDLRSVDSMNQVVSVIAGMAKRMIETIRNEGERE